jgi:integrase
MRSDSLDGGANDHRSWLTGQTSVSVDGFFEKNRTAARVFRELSQKIGIRGGPGQPRPRIHDLRHSFAVRSLEQCPCDRDAVSRQIVALSTYLGHAHVTDTYWYLQATPNLMAQIAEGGEALQREEV